MKRVNRMKKYSDVVEYFVDKEPKLSEILKEVDFSEWFHEGVSTELDIYRSLCRTIVGQQLSGKAANAIYQKFVSLVGDGFLPEDILKLEPEVLRSVGLSWAKVRSVLDLSEKVSKKEVLLGVLAKMDNEEVITELVRIKGIGRWTAEMFLMFRLCREDVFSWGDLGLKKGLEKYLETEFEENQFKDVVDSWSPYRTYGAIAMWHLLDNR